MKNEAEGIVTSVKKQWWLKINTKPVRLHSSDGAIFPHIITVSYTLDGREYTARKWIKASLTPPQTGDKVTVVFDTGKPQKAKVSLCALNPSMKESEITKNLKLSSTIFYLAAAAFNIAAVVSFFWLKDRSLAIIWMCLGSTFMCFGSVYLNKSKKDDTKDKENEGK